MPLLTSVGNAVTAIFSADTGPSFARRVDPDLPAALDAALVLDQMDREIEQLQLEPELEVLDWGGEDENGW